MTIALCVREDSGKYRLYCYDCRVDLGTLSGDGINAAIRHPASLGGVKCPECRKNSCKTCGMAMVGTSGVSDRECWWCQKEKEGNVQLATALPGLVKDSTKPGDEGVSIGWSWKPLV
jgi:hypothetical protein